MELSRKLQHVRKLMISAGINPAGIWEVDDLDKGIVVLAVHHQSMPDSKGENPRFDRAVKGLKIDVSDKSIQFSEGNMNPTVLSIGTPKACISQMMEAAKPKMLQSTVKSKTIEFKDENGIGEADIWVGQSRNKKGWFVTLDDRDNEPRSKFFPDEKSAMKVYNKLRSGMKYLPMVELLF